MALFAGASPHPRTGRHGVEDVRVVLEAAAIFVVLSAMATQFMICSYLTVLTRRVLRAIHLSAESRGV